MKQDIINTLVNMDRQELETLLRQAYRVKKIANRHDVRPGIPNLLNINALREAIGTDRASRITDEIDLEFMK